jgi:hypothetical protein
MELEALGDHGVDRDQNRARTDRTDEGARQVGVVVRKVLSHRLNDTFTMRAQSSRSVAFRFVLGERIEAPFESSGRSFTQD